MRIKNLHIILLFVFAFIFNVKAETVIKGKTYKGFIGKTVNIIEYKDYITYDFNITNSTTVDTAGRFFFNLNNENTQQVLIQIEHLIAILYIDVNQKYTIYFPPYSEDGTYRLTRNFTNLIFDSIPINDINGLILEFDRRVDQFFEDNGGLMGGKQFKQKIDTLKSQLEQNYLGIKNTYFLQYMKYTVASLDLITHSEHQTINKIAVYNTYLVNKFVDTKNNSYMLFFNQFYGKEFLIPTVVKSGSSIKKAINEEANFIALDTVLSKDYFMRNKTIRHLVMINNLYSLFNNELYSQFNIITILKELKQSSDNPEIKGITQNVINNLLKMKIGTKAINFTLKDANNESVSLSDFKGKYVYINFWATWSTESLAEMDLYPDFIEKYGQHVKFVSINIDSKKSKFDNFIVSHQKYKWNLLYYDGNTNLLDEYQINNLPSYILIDPNGDILQNPANRPSPNGAYVSIDKTFFDINKSLTKKKRWSIGTK
jgi:thiol-disulfide isomerase/thioredoxin